LFFFISIKHTRPTSEEQQARDGRHQHGSVRTYS